MFSSAQHVEPPDVLALLDAERFASAEAWEPDLWREASLGEAFGGSWHDSAACMAERSREELLFAWENAARQVACWQGEQTRILAAALDHALADDRSRGESHDAAMSVREVAAELGCAVGMSDRTIERQMNDALVMRDRFPRTLAALHDGELSRSHAQAIVDEGSRLTDDDARAAFEAVLLERGAGMTTGRLRALGKSIAEQMHPTSFADRHGRAREGRRATMRDAEDGMAEMWMLGPAALIHGAHDRATRMARAIEAGERAPADDTSTPRTLDQIRFDVLADLLLTGHPTAEAADADGGDALAAIQAIVQITVPVATVQGADEPAHLAGHGPIDPDTARILAGTATIWDRVLTDPANGCVVAVDRRFPTEAQRRHLRARDEHCRFPGCRMPTWRSDIDHTLDHQHGGATSVDNLAHLCRRHHILKHHTAWSVEQIDGELTWTSPLGRIYRDASPPTVRFFAHPPGSDPDRDPDAPSPGSGAGRYDDDDPPW